MTRFEKDAYQKYQVECLDIEYFILVILKEMMWSLNLKQVFYFQKGLQSMKNNISLNRPNQVTNLSFMILIRLSIKGCNKDQIKFGPCIYIRDVY